MTQKALLVPERKASHSNRHLLPNRKVLEPSTGLKHVTLVTEFLFDFSLLGYTHSTESLDSVLDVFRIMTGHNFTVITATNRYNINILNSTSSLVQSKVGLRHWSIFHGYTYIIHSIGTSGFVL